MADFNNFLVEMVGVSGARYDVALHNESEEELKKGDNDVAKAGPLDARRRHRDLSERLFAV
jgi:hypothetical protein